MKIKTFGLSILLLASALYGQNRGPDIDFAMSQLKTNGAVPFAKAIYLDDADLGNHLGAKLEPQIRNFGDYLGYEVVSRKYICKRVERVVLVIYFERRPLYLRVDYYETSKMRICLPWIVATDAAEVLPFDIISASGK